MQLIFISTASWGILAKIPNASAGSIPQGMTRSSDRRNAGGIYKVSRPTPGTSLEERIHHHVHGELPGLYPRGLRLQARAATPNLPLLRRR